MQQEQVLSDVQRLREALPELPEPVAKPFLVVVSGLPGTGKSYFSRKLANHLPFVILASDALRKTLFPSPKYDVGENQRLFSALHLLIEDLLSISMPVLLDATNLVERHRERLYHIADKFRVKLILVRVDTPSEVVQKRLEARVEGADPQDMSDADLSVYQRMRSRAQRIRRNHFAVDTSKDITPVIEKIVREAKW